MTQFYGKTKICYGHDALETIERLPATQAFIVTDPFMVRAGFIDQVKSHLERGGIACRVFAEVESDPSLEIVTKGSLLFLQGQAEAIIALGGGSVIDTAKAIAFFACKTDPGRIRPILVAIPTTSGTGSEVTAFSVITDMVNGIKIPLNDESLIPDLAILDARFTRTLPSSVTAATGMDVLTHAIEACTSRKANIFTSIYAKHAIRYIFRDLPRVFRHAEDMEARERLLLASCMAGMAFTNSGLGITHSMAHSLGGLFHIPHGLANAVLLPHVIRFNSFDAGMQYQEIAAFLSLPASTMEEGASSLVDAVQSLNADLNVPDRISALKVDGKEFQAQLDSMAHNALEDFCTKGSPRRPSHADIKALLGQAW